MFTSPSLKSENAQSSVATEDGPIIDLHEIQKIYKTAAGDFPALKNVDLHIYAGEFVGIIGKSGSGKSTLLNMITGIDRPTTGKVLVNGTAVHELGENRMARWRGKNLGIVFQFFQLLPTLTAAENVMLPMDFCGTWVTRERRDRALALLERLGVADQADKFPPKLSGGQQQRVAIARALANEPALLLADEPTGNLDSRTSNAILELFQGLVSEGQTVVMVTHEQGARRLASQTITLADGRIVANEAGSDG